MNIIRRTLDIDAATDARLRELAAERGQDESAVLAEAVALLDSVIDIGSPDITEDRRRLQAFRQTREAVPLHEMKAWVESWGPITNCRGRNRNGSDDLFSPAAVLRDARKRFASARPQDEDETRCNGCPAARS